MKKYYAIGEVEDVTYGQGNTGKETHICPINGYDFNYSYHPLFENRPDAEKYMKGLNQQYLKVVELNVYEGETQKTEPK